MNSQDRCVGACKPLCVEFPENVVLALKRAAILYVVNDF